MLLFAANTVFGAAGDRRSVADAGLIVQLDKESLSTAKLPGLLADIRKAGADGLEIAYCDFYLDGERRAAALRKMTDEVRFFEAAGLPVAIWTTSLGYGKMTDADFLRRFPDHRPLKAFSGKERAVCATDLKWRGGVAGNVRDFICAGAKLVLFDDDLVQACRPGIGCVCDEHLRRTAAKLNRMFVTADEIRDSYTGKPNAVRTAYLDAMGESLMEYCAAMRKAADEVDPSANLGLCASISHYDLDGVHMAELVRVLAAKGRRPFLRASGATYWAAAGNNPRNFGQGLGGVAEFVRSQIARYRGSDIVLSDENDSYPRDPVLVPPGMCELYDKVMIAEGGIIRNKYILRENVNGGLKGIDPAYLAAHAANLGEAGELAALFKAAAPCGFRVCAPEHLLREAVLPAKYIGDDAMLRHFTQPLVGILLAANGAPTQYERDDMPWAAFGNAALKVPASAHAHGVLLDREGAELLAERGVDVGLGNSKARQTGEWALYENAGGGRFAVCGKSQYELDYTRDAASAVPVDEIWKFFSGGDIPVRASGVKGLNVIAKERHDGFLAVLVCNMRGEPTGPFTVKVNGKARTLELPAWGSTWGKWR